jgi:hypothetical protein
LTGKSQNSFFASFVGTKKSGYPWREFIERPAELDAPAKGSMKGKGISPEYVRTIDPDFEDRMMREAFAKLDEGNDEQQ